MKIITLALAITFFLLAFAIIAGSIGFVNSNKAQVENAIKTNCVEVSYDVNRINYDSNTKTLKFFVKQRNDFSNTPISGVAVRPDDKSESVGIVFEKELANGMTKNVNISNITIKGDLFFVSPIGCSMDYEKRCYISKEACS